MLEVFDRTRRRIGILQNAYELHEESKINSIGNFYFTLPYDDAKNDLCQPYFYIRYNNGNELYRILPTQSTLDEAGNIQYTCEHVLALLLDNVLFGDHVVGNIGYYTDEVIEYVLAHQIERNWVLGECDFRRQFEYGWSQESLLSALFSIPNRFVDPYMWTFDTSRYPYVINLKRLDADVNPQMYIRSKKNMIKLIKTSDPTNLCTRLYPLGEGEGVNQLNIASINGGKPYIQSPQEYIDRYGVVERIWIDRRYTNQQSLYDAAHAMLNELQEPFEEYQIDFAMLGQDYFDVPEVGKIVEIVGFKKTYITGISKNHDETEKSTLTIANKPKDIASTVAELADRQRIEMAYSQGATQFYQDHVYENATPTVSVVLKLKIPSSMKIVNKVEIDVEVSAFRKPFTVTGGGGGQTISQSSTTSSGASSSTTTSSGGGSSTTTSSGGGTYSSTESGGGQSGTSEQTSLGTGTLQVEDDFTNFGKHNHGIAYNARLMVENMNWKANLNTGLVSGGTFYEFVASGAHSHGPHNHQFTVPSHSHSFSIGTHTHSVSISAHTHSMSHTHNISHTHSIPDHTHSLDPGISFSGSPSSFQVKINGVVKNITVGTSVQLDITSMLVDSQNKIPRDTYQRIEIVPNDFAFVMLTVNVQGFIQSRGDMTV